MLKPSILTQYILRELTAPFWASLVIVVAIIGLGQILQLMGLVFSLNIGGADFIRVCAYIIPKILLFGLPMAGALATITAFSRLSADNEILVLKGCGIGFTPIIVPVLLFAIFAAGLTAWDTTVLAPAATVNMKRLLVRLAKNRLAAGIRPGVFVDAVRDVIIHVNRIDPETGRLYGVYLNDLRDPGAPMTISAESGELVPDLEQMRVALKLHQGTALQLGRDKGAATGFLDYDLSMPVEPPRVIDGTAVSTVDEGGLSMSELIAGAEKLGPESNRARQLRTEFHHRLALPLGCFLLTLIGVSLGTSGGPGQKPPGLSAGLVLFILFYLMISAAKSAAELGRVPMLIAMWGPDVVLLFLTAICLSMTVRERYLPGAGEITTRTAALLRRQTA